MKLKIASHTIHYSICGEGPSVLLLHGFMESLHIWDPFLEDLSKKYKVIAVDLPGHGLSDDLKEDVSIDHMASLIKGLLDQLGETSIKLVGHSMGGYVSLAYADLFPNEINSLCLFHSMASPDSIEVKEIRDRKINLMAQHPHMLIEDSIQNLFWEDRKAEFEEEISLLTNQAKERKPSGYIQALEAMKKRPNRIHVLESGISIFYLVGQHDPVIPLEKSLSEIDTVKQGESYILNNSGHMGFIEEKNKSLDLLKEFLSR